MTRDDRDDLPRTATGRVRWAAMTTREVVALIYWADRHGDRRLLAAARRALAKRPDAGLW